MTKKYKNIDIFEYDCSAQHEKYKKYKKCQEITKTLTFLNMIAAKKMKTYKQIQNTYKKSQKY